jgi:hypothetical protein
MKVDRRRFRRWSILHIFNNETERIPSDDDSFWDSYYFSWINRIEAGHKAELEWISKLPEDKLVDAEGDFKYVDEVMEASGVSSNMYAALLVSLWSDLEAFLKVCCHMCRRLDKCSKNIAGTCNDFGGFKKCLEREIGFDITSSPNYRTINAVRLLNNAFKHKNGCYWKGEREHQIIDDALCAEWQIRENYPIDYTKLPHKELVLVCGNLCRDIAKILVSLTKEDMEKPNDDE